MKIKPVFLMIFFLSSFTFSQSINVINPKGGETWVPQKGYNIKWQVVGKMYTSVKIRLFTSDKSLKIMDIVNKTPNDGDFFWKIPSGLHAKCIIRIKTIDNAVNGESSPFLIETPKSTKKELDVWEPVSGVSYNNGDKIKIVWFSSGLTGNLNIFLEKSDGSKFPVKMNYPPSSSTIYYTVPNSIVPGIYKIRAVWGSLTDVSGVFTIKSPSQKKSMIITRPKTGQVYNTGAPLSIEWVSSGLTGQTLRVFICKGTPQINYVATISDHWPNSPHLQAGWKIPDNFAEGDYKIVVQEGGSTYYHGNIFKIKRIYRIKEQQGLRQNTPLIRMNPNLRFKSGKKPIVFSFMPHEFAKKIAQGSPGKQNLWLVKLNFLWKDPDSDLKNGKWHFSFKGTKSGKAGNKSGKLTSVMYSGNFNGTSGSISNFYISNISGIDKEIINIVFVLEDEQGNFSDKVTGQIILSPF